MLADDWDDDDDDRGVEKEEAIKGSKKIADKYLGVLYKKADAFVNSPSLTKGLLNEDEVATKKKKLKKKKSRDTDKGNSDLPVEEPKSDDKPDGSKKSLKKSGSLSEIGSILKKGIKFSNLEDFVKFVDGGKKRKRKEREEEEEGTVTKKAKISRSNEVEPAKSFDINKLRTVLSNAKNEEESKEKLKLKSSRFRYLNELLYTQTGSQSQKMFDKDRGAFETYHVGYMEQVAKWPSDPLQTIIAALMKRSGDPVIADFGCGDARLARALPTLRVHSFDFVALNERVTECDMAKTPLKPGTVDIAVFCLSLMGTNLRDYLKEANRVLKMGGILKVAEVESRFQQTTVDQFVSSVAKFGFALKWKETQLKFFVFIDFEKKHEVKKKTPEINLKPCWYKKR